MAQPPEYSPLRSESYPLDHTSFTAVTKNSPHTTPLRFDSPNANPQLGQAQLDFIPMPNSPPSAPAHFSTTIPDADDDAKYETSMSTPLTMSDPKHSSPKPALPYPTPTPAPSSHIDQRENLENVTIVDAVPVDERYKKKSPDGNNFFMNVRDPRKKTFWAVTIIFLAIFFGILGATVWKPDSKANNPGVPSPEMLECTQKCVND
ncbi:hypothetical protein BGZ81_007764 [Podila clonocystis]|nr:hypothetical protein BGZ81_007764 [Podila clonocystis]